MCTLLIVEDEEILLERLVKTIDWESIGINKVIGIARSEEALNVLITENVDIILTDIRMPIMDGLDLAEFVHSRLKHPLSGYKEFEYAHRAIKLGVVDYILKPFTKEEVLETVKKAVEKVAAEQSRQQRLDSCENKNIIDMVFDFIFANCSKQISLNDVAEYVHLHPVYLSRLLKNKTGKTFKEILTEVRLKKAEKLLKTSSLKHYEIAEAVGFSDAQYFSQVFKKVYGMTPIEWKKQVLENKARLKI
ncbi:two component transcriptional regulator, AraC family [Caldicellulosiruptor hydrothermalis 108]|uniref:Two component transcriptional regulator, AraC family n=1 Tax=Caldicellulosiruptor hydrothermalis (strain DSM 18901 / VKM B-2411 / 108) TaxID=632292 RepID=E4Q9F4_CALH1|nr:helix-turn-helix domain-containing protein [Caldicellulosiruptor hydrothermalis]ADQ05825.1 two component transcriptional regulator, AraC family [Caldicellulosiruptor hydrothermalis 108]